MTQSFSLPKTTTIWITPVKKKLLLDACESFCLSVAFQVPGVLYMWCYHHRVDNKESICSYGPL